MRDANSPPPFYAVFGLSKISSKSSRKERGEGDDADFNWVRKGKEETHSTLLV